MRRRRLPLVKLSPARMRVQMLRSPSRGRLPSQRPPPKLANAPPNRRGAACRALQRWQSRNQRIPGGSRGPLRRRGTSVRKIAGSGSSPCLALKIFAISSNIFFSYCRIGKRPVRKTRSSIVCTRLLPGVLASLALLAAPTVARAQDAPPQYPPGNEFAVWGGYSLGNSQVFGVETNRQLGEFALRYARTLYDKPFTSLQYTLDVIPVETVRQYTFAVCMPTPTTTAFCANGRETVYGGGVNPIGLKLNFRRENRLQPFIASTAGFVASLRPVPVDIPGGTQFNFTFDFQTGVDLFN